MILSDEASGNMRSGGDSGSSHKESLNYSSYAVFMYCKDPLVCEPVFRRKRTLQIKELDEAAEYDPEVNAS